MTKKILPIASILISFFIFLIFFSTSAQAQSSRLDDAYDVMNNTTPFEHSTHAVTFTLPANAAAIRTTDYIQIVLGSGFTNVTAPIRLDGAYGGTPVFSVSGNAARVTGITAPPGATITVDGIDSDNGPIPFAIQVAVMITEDEAGTIIKNYERIFGGTRGTTAKVTASIQTPESSMVISGITAPQTFITFTELGSVTGTDVAGLDGHFGRVFSGLEPGNHQVVFFGIDSNRFTTTPVSLEVYTPAYQEITVANQILSPTIWIDKLVYGFGEHIIASGTAVPNGNITLFTEAPLRSYSTTSDSEGNWTYDISNTTSYVFGDYHIHALVQSDTGFTSLNSPSLGFSIRSSSSTGTTCGNISHGDLNCDSGVNLTDFSILMYFWGTNNAAADINTDQLVDLTDFSIMMYWWG